MTKSSVLRGQAFAISAALALALALLLPAFMAPQFASAAEQVSSRSVTIDKSGRTETDVEYDFDFTLPSTGVIQGIRLQFCTTPLGACTTLTGLDVSSMTVDAQTFSEATNFADGGSSDENDCTESTNSTREICLERVDTDPETAAAKSLTLSGITHTAISADPATVYVRMAFYNNDTFTPGGSNANILFDGVVAAAIVDTLTVQARVQENLQFCVGTTTVNDDSTNPGNECSDITGTTVDIGVVDTTTTGAVSPDADGNSLNGIAWLRTNANGGTTVGYKAVQQSGTNHVGALRVLGSSCDAGNVNTDQCFRSFSTQTALAASTEQFGMTVEHVNDGSGGLTNAVTRTADYDGSAGGYAWDESGTLANVANASGAVDDEALILKFAAVAAITTPTGSYQAQAKFIATPTF